MAAVTVPPACPVVVRCRFIKLQRQGPVAEARLKLLDWLWLQDLTVSAGYRLVIWAVCGNPLSHREPFPGRSGCGAEPRDAAKAEAGMWRSTDPAQE